MQEIDEDLEEIVRAFQLIDNHSEEVRDLEFRFSHLWKITNNDMRRIRHPTTILVLVIDRVKDERIAYVDTRCIIILPSAIPVTSYL